MGADGPFGPVVNGTQIVFYQYRPNEAAGFSFVALFGLATLGHLIYLFALRAWYFIPFILGGIGEAFGYYGRVRSSENPDTAGPFIQQNLLILASPPFIAATIYMSLGRIIAALNARRHSLISPRWLTKIYVLIDIGCVVTQVLGSILPASGTVSSIELSKKILIGGLITQVAALAFFILTCWHLHSRIKREPPEALMEDPGLNWQNHFRAIEVVTLVLLVRTIVRAIEFLQGSDGFVASHEVFIYVFDAFLMFSVMLVFLIIHPGRLIRDLRRFKRGDWSSEGHRLVETR